MRKFFLSILICCSACTLGPDYKPDYLYSEKQIKEELQLSPQPTKKQDWRQNFADEQLYRLVEIGLKNNTDINTAISRLQQSRIRLKIDQVSFLPTIEGQANYQYEHSSDNIVPSVDTKVYSLGFDASWEIDIWGKGRRQTEADRAEIKSAEYNLEDIKTMIIAEIIKNYIKLAQSREQLSVAQKNAHLQQQILSTVSVKYNNGLTDDISYNQAKYLLAQTKAQIPGYQTQVEAYKNAIAEILGLLPSAVPLNISSIKILSLRVNKNSEFLYQIPADVIRKRPDVSAAEQTLISQNALIGKAVASMYPNVSISGLLGLSATNNKRLFDSSSQTYGYEPSAVLPILDWNKLQNNIELQKEITKEKFISYQKTVLDAVTELKNSTIQYQNSINTNQQQKQALDNIKKALDSLIIKYNNGLAEFSDVLTMQQNFLSAENDYITGKSQVLQNLTAFYKACGAFIDN